MSRQPEIRRTANGAIDTEYYMARAHEERGREIRAALARAVARLRRRLGGRPVRTIAQER